MKFDARSLKDVIIILLRRSSLISFDGVICVEVDIVFIFVEEDMSVWVDVEFDGVFFEGGNDTVCVWTFREEILSFSVFING